MIMENKTALQIDDRNISEEEAGFYRYEKVLEFVKKLGQALEKKDLNKIIEVFQDRIAIRSMMILRGKYDQYLQLIVDSFILLLQKHDIELIKKDLQRLIEFLHENNISEFIIHEILSVAFHVRNEGLFNKLEKMIDEQKNIFHKEKVYYWLLHSRASWYEVFKKDHKKAIEFNLRVVFAMKNIDRVLYLKAKFGLTYNKELMPKQKIKDFLYFSEEFLKENNLHDAFRGEVEAGRAYLALARQQGLKNDAFDTLEQAKNIILKSLRVSKEINYPNLEIIASEMMADIYKERIKKVQAYLKVKSRDDFIINIIKRTKDDERKMSSFLKKAGIARKKYNYQTVFTEKYKKEYYKHIT
ncbi:hypothetical protein A2331_06375 [Candidatus Falkowbacteria bacterium RIFOXYB2_FULL_34_18]|uniref:Uncharacterized protein n=1 Tax=Candidatus Falkowbacteria bacterium RIFOXYD2_FULL_34_120 TaxID=1798007 RepID=A0A1F5TQN6_9BACT|nr:MAG: hypothetical protein A2331_06375 [Candidatus Falkowbacteria bacterium RIFOXYB2_FULL_34_18]OGF29394.1 MAG: hypothetical protein A2500_06465 [Candidatus Falkowbacteria bacterium RIFOXYC12_FULL_34_55]OGF36603.1 MAG: hypothetical protein A2466_06800 [Candidatus Falkowbacteria bacterium RIFOXYC2_FULL_34_220]OGF38821.1 MAG: hypothetical protein A2515_03245 [Candidatus Falkowbacteria bacterium RIFOXYD12_FULL_34_57]OGF41074.1 MAG: hypothetical protein A2531_03250 [Candidatus Falkowbacteria bact